MRRLALVLLVIASCDYDAAYQRYCDGNPLCATASAGSGGSIAPGGSGGGGSGGDGGDAGSGGEAGSGGSSAPQPPTYCTYNDTSACDPETEVCNYQQKECLDRCKTNDDCSFPEQYCKDDWFGFVSGCSCGLDTDCASAYPGTICHRYTLRCERPCKTSRDCTTAERPYCIGTRSVGVSVCVQCRDYSDCKLGEVCGRQDSQAQFTCTGCFNSSDCSGRNDGRSICRSFRCIAP